MVNKIYKHNIVILVRIRIETPKSSYITMSSNDMCYPKIAEKPKHHS